MKKSKAKEKPTYTLISNIIFLYSMQWKYSKASLFLLIMEVPISLGLSYCSIYLPKIVVRQVLNNNPFHIAIVPIITIGIVILFLKLCSQIISTINFALLTKFRSVLINLKIEKCLFTDYENIESPKFRFLMQRSDEALWGSNSGSAVEQMSRECINLLTSILGYILFGTILTFANPLLIIVTIMPLINYFIIKSIQKFQYTSKDITAPLDKKLWYITTNANDYKAAKDIRIYGMNDWLLNMYHKITKERLKWSFKISAKYFFSDLLDGIFILLRDGVAYIVLIIMVINNKITIDNFVLYFSAAGSFTSMVGSIINQFSSINAISLLTCDLRDFLNYPEKSNRSRLSPYLKNMSNAKLEIRLQNLSFIYPESKKEIISNLSFTIAPGEKLAIVGLNGAGKTTLVKLICGLYKPTNGDILINGINSKEFNIYDYYSLFSVVFQDHNFMPISIAETVSCNKLELTDEDRVIECLEEAGLYSKISTLKNGIYSLLNRQLHEDGVELSEGEYQKLLLARALYKNSPILILDEPTASLDPIAENELYLKYNSIFKDKTSIFISHRLSSTKFCDRILLLRDGQVIESGTHDELMNKGGEYARLYEIQRQYYINGGDET